MSDVKFNPSMPPAPVSGAEFLENLKTKQNPLKDVGAQDFSKVLDAKVVPEKTNSLPGELKFSAHAQSRLSSRGIELKSEDLVKMQEAIEKMKAKGSRESLILSEKGAFIVSIKNNTVITAVDKESMKENVFTNIDSTIMI